MKEKIVTGQLKRVELKRDKNGCYYLDYEVSFPSYTEIEFEIFKDKTRTILEDLILEFYTEETGHYWKVFLRDKPTSLLMSLIKLDLRLYSSPNFYLK